MAPLCLALNRNKYPSASNHTKYVLGKCGWRLDGFQGDYSQFLLLPQPPTRFTAFCPEHQERCDTVLMIRLRFRWDRWEDGIGKVMMPGACWLNHTHRHSWLEQRILLIAWQYELHLIIKRREYPNTYSDTSWKKI